MAGVGCRNSVFQCGALSAGPEVDLFHFNVNAMALREIMFKCFLNVNYLCMLFYHHHHRRRRHHHHHWAVVSRGWAKACMPSRRLQVAYDVIYYVCIVKKSLSSTHWILSRSGYSLLLW